jgi:hypothetical protein
MVCMLLGGTIEARSAQCLHKHSLVIDVVINICRFPRHQPRRFGVTDRIKPRYEHSAAGV